jgi:hypothetical protein
MNQLSFLLNDGIPAYNVFKNEFIRISFKFIYSYAKQK